MIYAFTATTASSTNHGLFGTQIELFDQFDGAEIPVRALVGLFGLDKCISLPESLLCLLLHFSEHFHALIIEQRLLPRLGMRRLRPLPRPIRQNRGRSADPKACTTAVNCGSSNRWPYYDCALRI